MADDYYNPQQERGASARYFREQQDAPGPIVGFIEDKLGLAPKRDPRLDERPRSAGAASTQEVLDMYEAAASDYFQQQREAEVYPHSQENYMEGALDFRENQDMIAREKGIVKRVLKERGFSDDEISSHMSKIYGYHQDEHSDWERQRQQADRLRR